MSEKITRYGTIVFDPPELNDKHISQSEWKKIAIIELNDDSARYYSWFLQTRYNIELNPIQRGAHVTLINDSFKDLSQNFTLSKKEVDDKWKALKKKWNGKEIEVKILLEPKTDDNHWWFNVPHEDREHLQAIRNEIGLGKPFWGFHMSFGIIHPHSKGHSRYIHMILKHENDLNHISKKYARKLLTREEQRKLQTKRRR